MLHDFNFASQLSAADDDDDELFALQQQAELPPEDPAALEYIAACTSLAIPRCSQWTRACVSEAPNVSLCHYGLGKRGVDALSRSLTLNMNIQALDLGDNGLGSEGVTTLLTALRSPGAAPKLRVLSLRQNQAGEDGAEALRDLIAEDHPLASIDFASNGLGGKGATMLAEGLLSNSSLTALCLEHNEIDEIDKLAEALSGNSSLTSLSLEWNSLPPASGPILAGALRDNNSLTALNLGWNGLGDDGISALAHAIETKGKDASTLRDVRLHHNRMTEGSTAALSRALGGLDLLDVSGNALAATGCAVLLGAQQELRRVEEPVVDLNSAGENAEESTEDAEPQPPPPRPPCCRLIMEDCCVRPDTALAGLLQRAGTGEALPTEELDACEVQKLAAPALAGQQPPALRRAAKAKAAEAKKWESDTTVIREEKKAVVEMNGKPEKKKGKGKKK